MPPCRRRGEALVLRPLRHARRCRLRRARPASRAAAKRPGGGSAAVRARRADARPAVGRHGPALAGAEPVVDDAQWLDAPTRSVLAFAARRLDQEPVGVVCASRPSAEVLGVLASLERERVTRLSLGPLATEPMRTLIGERVTRPPPLPLLTRLAEASGGNPL